MIPFILDPEGIAELHRIRDYAYSHPADFYTLKKMMEGMIPVPGDNDNFLCLLPPKKDWPYPKFKVVYSIEEQPVGKLRHLSVSIVESARMPSPHAVDMIMKELGFKHEMMKCKVWIEESPVKAVNVLDWYE